MVFPTETLINNYKLFWQYPVITEETFYNQNKNDEHYIGFPWATIIDKRYDLTIILKIIRPYINSSSTYYTCCQHIHFRQLLVLFKVLNIKTVYSPHKVIDEDILNDITIKACPLYAANIEDQHRNQLFQTIDFLTVKRKYVYSFQGAYDKQCYLTDIRDQIFKMKHPEHCYIKNIGYWHYNTIVYSNKQNKDKELNETHQHIHNQNEYNQLLLDSEFSLCPSGSGPNSIRLWECLAIGTIPILLADTLDLPIHELWDDAIIRIKEKDLNTLPDLLSTLSESKKLEMRQNCIKLYTYFKDNYKNESNESNESKESKESKESMESKNIVHYCCGSYEIGDFGGVARYDYHIKLAFPNRKFFKGPEQKTQLLEYLYSSKNPIVITDNHLVCDIPNKYKTYLVHHGVAQTHAEREPEWNPYWKNLCCSGQEKMLYYRKPETTTIISISQFCTDEFTHYYKDTYTKFKNTKLLHTTEFDETRYKTSWNKKPIILGNWKDANKGLFIIQQLKNSINDYEFKHLNTYPLNINEIENWINRKQTLYLECDLFLQLSLCEGNSYATLDALLCGIPVVSSNVGLFYKDIPEDCFVKIDWKRNNDLNYIKEKIDYALEHKEDIGKKGREWVLKNCNIKDWINKISHIII
jgi:glycosyltransferase involved in cell wall biosynthesis